nr:exopolygalacturonase-like [Tanacetum cinerariifolium]
VFTRAWNDACASNTGGTILIPRVSYVLGAVEFKGPCKGPLLVTGGGYLCGHGSSAWLHNDCAVNPRCKRLPFTTRFEFVSNSKINYIQSIDSRSGHFDLYSCQNVEMSNIWMSAPYWSPNTDGIHMGASSQIRIYDSTKMTGDDCISMVSGTHDVDER